MNGRVRFGLVCWRSGLVGSSWTCWLLANPFARCKSPEVGATFGRSVIALEVHSTWLLTPLFLSWCYTELGQGTARGCSLFDCVHCMEAKQRSQSEKAADVVWDVVLEAWDQTQRCH